MLFLVFTGAWFWILTVAFFALLVCEVAGEKTVAAVFTVILYLLLIHLFGDAAVFSTVMAHPEYIYIGVPVFFAVGALWALTKWWFYVKRKALEYRRAPGVPGGRA